MLTTTAALLGGLAILALTLASAYFSSSEIAVFSLPAHRLDGMPDSRRVGTLRRLKADPHRLLVTILVGNNVVNIAIASIATVLLADALPAEYAVVASTLGVSTVVLVFGEIVPKSYGVANAESWAVRSAGSLATLQWVLYPIVAAFDRGTAALARLVGGERDLERPYVTREELSALVGTAEEQGVIDDEEERMLQGVFEFAEITAGEVMTPRADVVAVAADTPVDEALATCARERRTRLPVFETDLDSVVGYVDVRDLLGAEARGEALTDVLNPVLHVFEGRALDEVLEDLRAEGVELAVVFDQFGAAEGLLTLEDLAEAVVGELYDVGERRTVVPLDAGGVRARGKAAVGDVATALGTPFGDDDLQTVAGLLADRLGRPAEEGETVRVDGVALTVERVAGNRVRRVHVESEEVERPPDEDGTEE